MSETLVAAAGVSFKYPGADRPAVLDVTVSLHAGELVAIIGPNGSGKTTLLRLLAGLLRPRSGTVRILDVPSADWKRKALAREVAVVAQREEPAFPLRVRQVVMLGRYPYLSTLGIPQPRDREAVDRALARCDVTALERRWVTTLSGGEWQRVRIARALAQEPRLLCLDEATSNLDLRHEMEVFGLTARLVHASGLGGVFVTHQVNLAARFADRVVVMQGGRACAVGRPGDVLTTDVIASVFAWPVAREVWNGRPQFVPLDPPFDPGAPA